MKGAEIELGETPPTLKFDPREKSSQTNEKIENHIPLVLTSLPYINREEGGEEL